MTIQTGDHVLGDDRRITSSCRIKLWHQLKPYPCWVLKVSVRCPFTGNAATARTWLDEFTNPRAMPPYTITGPLAHALRITAQTAIDLTP